jgi:hypothetical protein
MSVYNTGQAVEAEDIFYQVWRQLRRDVLLPGHGTAIRFYSGAVRNWNAAGRQPTLRASEDAEEISGLLQTLYTSLNSSFADSVARIGGVPPVTATVRGYFGCVAIRVLQRLLWWYTRSLHHFVRSVGMHFHDTTEVIESLACMQEANRIEIAALREEVRLLRESSAAGQEIRR